MATTYVVLVIDASGSMARLATEVRRGVNGYIAELGKAADVKFAVTIVTFNTLVTTVCVAATLDQVPELTVENYHPDGFTALLDAVGAGITEFEAEVTLDEGDRVLLVINTDGQENSSQRYSWRQIRDMITTRELGGRWSTLYMGQGADSWDQGDRFSVGTRMVANSSTLRGTRSGYVGMSVGTVDYARGADVDEAAKRIQDTPGVGE